MRAWGARKEHFITHRGVTIRIRRVITGGFREPHPLGWGTFAIKKLVRYEITHNGRYLWSDSHWMRARKAALKFAENIAERKGATDGQ